MEILDRSEAAEGAAPPEAVPPERLLQGARCITRRRRKDHQESLVCLPLSFAL